MVGDVELVCVEDEQMLHAASVVWKQNLAGGLGIDVRGRHRRQTAIFSLQAVELRLTSNTERKLCFGPAKVIPVTVYSGILGGNLLDTVHII